MNAKSRCGNPFETVTFFLCKGSLSKHRGVTLGCCQLNGS
jgi:hypothetical protein